MISCIILAGGKSSRIKKVRGRKKKPAPKAFMILDDKPLVIHVFNTVKKFFREIIIVVKTKKQKLQMEKLVRSPRVRVVADKSKAFSPIIGIKAGLPYVSGADVFVIGCDMPFINGVTIFRLMNRVKKGTDCVVPSKTAKEGRKYEPLCAIYKKHILKTSLPNESLHNLIDRCKKLLVPIYNESIFFNINTHEDLKQAEKMLEKKTRKKK